MSIGHKHIIGASVKVGMRERASSTIGIAVEADNELMLPIEHASLRQQRSCKSRLLR